MKDATHYLSAPLEQLRVLRKPETLALVGLSATRVRYLEAEGKFPARLALGDNAIGYLEVEVREWLAERAKRGAVKPLGARAAHVAPTPAKAPPKPATAVRKPARVLPAAAPAKPAPKAPARKGA